MTEREFIDKMIEGHKEGYDSGTLYVCHKIKCDECPLADTAKECRAGEKTTPMLVNEIIRLREEKSEKVETNLEHFFYGVVFNIYGRDATLLCNHRDEMLKSLKSDNKKCSGIEWLLSPYEEPKRYKMSQLYHDMIAKWLERYEDGKITRRNVYKFIDVLFDMGIFFDYDDEIKDDIEALKTLLENAEVVEE